MPVSISDDEQRKISYANAISSSRLIVPVVGASGGTVPLDEDAEGPPPRTRRRLAILASRSLSFLLKASLSPLSPPFLEPLAVVFPNPEPLFMPFFHACFAKYLRSLRSIIVRPWVPGSPSGLIDPKNSRRSSAERMEEVMISTVFVPGSPALCRYVSDVWYVISLVRCAYGTSALCRAESSLPRSPATPPR